MKVKLKDENDFLVYNDKIVTPAKSIMDVRVDAGSGEILAVELDSDDNEPEKNPS